MPVARQKPGVATVNGQIVVTGGWDSVGNPIAQTDVYDPNSDTWTTVAPNPSPAAAPGVAVAGGDVYFVGGCADAFCDTTTSVVRYDPSADTWSSVAAYPRSDGWMSCGGISDKVYCSGGTDGINTFKSGDVYDPGSDSWSPIADMPIDLWASAAGAANGQLIAAGGVTDGFNTVTNQVLGYDPASDAWTALPNAPTPRYRSGGACGFFKIGGSSGGFTPTPDSELLSELNTCGTTDVPWLSETPTSGTVAPGGSQAVQVTIDTHGLAFGIYKANLIFRTNSGRHPNITVPIQLHVRYQQAFNSGGGSYTDSNGDPWSADRAYTPANNSGYVQSPSKTASTKSAIGGTTDDPLYQAARITPMTYRFTALHQGVYHVELRFAEIQGKKPGKRQFDVIVNGQPYLIAFDIAALVGQNYAYDKSLNVTVPAGGEVSVQLAERRSFGDPILNGIRLTSLP
jgi:N-acetylneuraminic acid mutarotase